MDNNKLTTNLINGLEIISCFSCKYKEEKNRGEEGECSDCMVYSNWNPIFNTYTGDVR